MSHALMRFIDDHNIVSHDEIRKLEAKEFIEAWGNAVKLRKQMEALIEAFQSEAVRRTFNE